MPYASSGSAYTTPTTVSNLYTNYLYDSLKRLTSEANAVSIKTNSYSKWTTLTTDPNSNIKQYSYDAFGNLIEVAERGLFTATSTTAATSTGISIETGTNGTAILTKCEVGTTAQLQKTVSSTSTLLVVTVTSIGVSSMTYAGAPMSLAASYPGAVETWYIANPTSGSNSIDITFTASTRAQGAATSYTGTQIGSPFGATATSTGSGGNPSLSITTNYQNPVIHDNLFHDIDQSLTPNALQVSLEAQSCPPGGNSSHGSSYRVSTSTGTYTLGWTHGGAGAVWYDVGVEVRPSTGNETVRVPYTATTTYTYDTQGNLATTTDSRGNVRGFTYDAIGRRLTAHDLHNATDTTFGIWSYSYDDQGNLTSQNDPKGQTVNRTYDALNRMRTENYTGAAGTEMTLVYDSCTNGIGYLCSASSTAATTTNAYDILGRLTSATTTVLNTAYNMQYTHDRQGNVTSWTYPNSTVATVSYNTAGLPSRVQRKPSGGSFSDIVSSLTYSPTGQSITTVFGNGASTTRTYNADALYRLSNLKTLANGSNVQNFSYTYDNVGNITQIANPAAASSSATTIFTYDALNRLLQASTTAADSLLYKQQYEYDTLGSMLALWNGSATSTYSYSNTGNANPHAVTETSNGVSTTTYSYDANGNLAQKTTNNVTTTYLWDYANRLTALGVNNSTTTYGYDAFGSRVTQVTATTSTLYPSKWYSVASSTGAGASFATTTEYIFNGDTLLSFAEATTTVGGGGGGSSGDTGWKTTGTVVVNTGWSSFTTTVINSSDDSRASCDSFCDNSDDAQMEDFSFGIPTDATIDGIQVQMEANEGVSSGDITVNASLSWNDGVSFTSTKTAIVDGTADATYTFGTSTTDKWGRVWDDADFANGTFRLRIDKASSLDTVNIDHIQVKVYYTTAGGGGGGGTGTATVRYIHPDHLGSTNIVTNAGGTAVVQTLDYYPYGATRISTNTGSANSARKYIGQFADTSNLDYLNARYYDPARGEFLSQDPTYLSVGDPNQIRQLVNQKQQTLLMDPQQLNSYGYGRSNPISNKDATGNGVESLIAEVLRNLDRANNFAQITNQSWDLYFTFGNPNIPEEQHVIVPTDLTITGLLTLPEAAPVSFLLFSWEGFKFAGEKITGRSADDAPAYMEELKRKLRKEQPIPGFNLPMNIPPPTIPGIGQHQRTGSNTTGSGGSSSGSSQVRSGGSSQTTMVRNVVVGFLKSGAPLYCSGVCGR